MSNWGPGLKLSKFHSFEEKTEDDPPENNNNNNNHSLKTKMCSKSSGTNLRPEKNFAPVHQGFLTKQGGTIKNWRKRFFTLRSNSVLYYYRDVNKDPQGEIDLTDDTFAIRKGTWEDGCWSKTPLDRTLVIDTKNRRYYFFSETVQEAQTWLEMITEVKDRPSVPDKKAKSSTLPSQGRSATVGDFIIQSKKSPGTKTVSPPDESPSKQRAFTVSAKYQELPPLPLNPKISEDLSCLEHYSSPDDILGGFTPGEGQREKRRSTLYKCRSVEDFASSSSYEVSKLLESTEEVFALPDKDAIYDSPKGAESKDDLYGMVINGTDKPSKPMSRPKMELPKPEIAEYAITKHPVPDALRRNLMPLDLSLNNKQQHKQSDESLGVGVYSMIQPDDMQDPPVPKPRSKIFSSEECVYDEVPVEELYDEINMETRAGLMELNQTETDLHSYNTQPDNDHGTLQTEDPISTYDQLTLQDGAYDVVHETDETPLIIRLKSVDGILEETGSKSPCSSLELTAMRTIRVRTVSEGPGSPKFPRRKQDPLPPVPNSPLLSPRMPTPPGANPKKPTLNIGDDDETGEKPAITPYLGPDPLVDYTEDTSVLAMTEEASRHYETQPLESPYSKVKRSQTIGSKTSTGKELFERKKEQISKQATFPASSREIYLSEEENKLARLRRECNREEKKSERIEGDLKMKKKLDEIRKDQELIQSRLEGIRAKNIHMLVEEGKISEIAGVKSGSSDTNNELERIKIEREKLELEKDRHQLEREKLEMEKERSEMEKMKLEHQKLLFEREKFIFEKEKMELERAKRSQIMSQSSDL